MGGGMKVGSAYVPPPQAPLGETNGVNGAGGAVENAPNGSVRGNVAPVQKEDPFAGVPFEKLPANVKLSRQLVGYGAAERYRKLIGEYKPQDEKTYDRNSYRGQYEMIRDSAVGFCRKFVESGLDAWCEAARKAGASEARIGALAEQIRAVRVRLTQHLTQELAAAHDRMMSIKPDTREYDAAILGALGDVKAALRNLRYSFDREHGLMTEYSSFKRSIGQFFSNSSRRHDREAAGQFQDLTALERELKALGGGAADPAAEEARLRELSGDSHAINEAIRNIDKSVDSRSYAFGLAKYQIQDLAKFGGEKSIDVSAGAGAGINIGVFNVKLMAKGHHGYRIHSTGDGSVTIEHLNELGVGARARVGVDNLAKVEIGGEFCGGIKTGNSSVTFKDVDSAARYMSGDWLGKFNPLTLYDSIGKFTMDVIGAAKSFFKPFCWLGRTIVAKILRYDTTQDPTYGANGEEEFVKRMTSGNILGKVAERILPGANILTSGKREYGTIRLNGEVTGEFNTGFAYLKGGIAEEAEFQKHAVRTDYKPYMALLEDEMHGTMLARVEKAFAGGEDVSEEDARTAELVFSDGDDLSRLRDLMSKPAERTPKAILDALKGLSGSMDGFAKRVRNGSEKLDPEHAAARYRATARVAAALLEMWEAIPAGGRADDQQAEFGRISAQVREMVTNPAVEFTDEQLNRGLKVSRTEADDMFVNRATVTMVYDALGKHSFKVMQGDEALGGTGAGSRFARAATEGGLTAGTRVTGLLQNSAEVEFVTRKPNSRHRRPWQNDRRTEINLRLGPDSAVIDFILLAVGKAVSSRTKMEKPPTSEDLMGIATSALGGAVVGTLKRLCKDFFANPSFGGGGPSLTQAQQDAFNVNASSMLGRLDVLGGRNIQLVLEDGRLTGISFGDQYKMDIRAEFGEGVVVEGEFKMNSVANRNTYALDPSFHSLLSKCDGMLRYGNRTNWEMYAANQRGSLVRMFDIVRNDILDGRQGTAAQAKDEKDLADAGQFRAIFRQMSEDLAQLERMTGPRSAGFRKNWETFNVLLAEISSADGKTDEIVKGEKMQRLLECITNHFNLMDMDLAAEEPLNPELAVFRDFAAANNNGWFKVASFGRGSDGRSAVSMSDDRVWRLQPFNRRPSEHLQANRLTRSRLLKAILMELHPEEAATWEHLATVMDFKGMLEKIPKEIRSQMKPEDFSVEGKPLSAYRIGRIIDAVLAYRNGQALNKVDDERLQGGGEKIFYP